MQQIKLYLKQNNIMIEAQEKIYNYNLEELKHIECMFCQQFVQKSQPNLFETIFNSQISPIILESDEFVWGIALGPLVEGYTMIISKQHILSFANTSFELYDKLEAFKEEVINYVFKAFNIYPLIFEHGAVSSRRKGGCCVNHAHLHIVPIDIDITTELNKNFVPRQVYSIKESRANFEKNISYLYLEYSSIEEKYIYNVNSYLPSQYIRQILYKELRKPTSSWDWREYIGKKEIISTLQKYKSIIY